MDFSRKISVGEDSVEKAVSISSVTENIKNPLLLSPVIRNVYNYLSLKDIKKCRTVTWAWKSASETFLRNRSKIVFDQNKDPEFNFTPKTFGELFKETQDRMPFYAFRISSCKFSPWAINEFRSFFECHHKSIRELKLDWICLTDEARKSIVDKFNITAWISKSPMTKENARYNTKLSVTSLNGPIFTGFTLVMVSLEVVAHVKDLSLQNCKVYFKEDVTKIQPIKLSFEDVKFFREENILDEVRINDLVDFSRVRTMTLKNTHSIINLSESRHQYSKMILDLGDNGARVNLEKLTLQGVKVVNWRLSRISTNLLIITRISFLEKTDMCIREMHFQCTKSKIDLFALPQSIEKLSITWLNSGEQILCSQPIALQNLKHLTLNFSDNGSTLCHFHNCPKLVSLNLDVDYGERQLTIKCEWIPKTVKILQLLNVKLVMEEVSCGLNLERLILRHYCYSEIKEFLVSNFRTNDLVLWSSKDFCSPGNFIQFLKCHSSCVNRIFVGPFPWNYYPFKFGTEFSKLVNEKAEYYEFENMKGKGMPRDDYEKLVIKEKHLCPLDP